MRPNEVTTEYVQSLTFQRVSVANGPSIQGVECNRLKMIVDGRGDVIELWSLPWLQTLPGLIQPQHVYQSATDYSVIKAWHLHAIHTDQFTVTRGKMQVVCVDIRPDSPTFTHVNSFIMGIQAPAMLIIPPGIMHGWKALSQPETIVVNLQSHPYDPDDEFKLPWNAALTDVWEPLYG